MAETAKGTFWDMEDSLGSYLGEIANSTPLSASQEVNLARKIKDGDGRARNALVEANLRFVVSVAKEYQNRGVPLSDLISAGNVGLITAAERFDENKGFKFISYAVWWIRQAILQTLAEQARTVRLPLNKIGLLYKISKASRSLQQQRADAPNPEDIATELDVLEEAGTEQGTGGVDQLAIINLLAHAQRQRAKHAAGGDPLQTVDAYIGDGEGLGVNFGDHQCGQYRR